MVMRRARPCSRLRWRAMTQSASASLMRNSSWRSGAFSKRDNVGCEARSSPSMGSRPTNNLCTGSHARRAASLASSYPKAMPITRCVSSSSISCKILPGCRSSRRQAANAEVQTQPPVGRLEQDRAAIGTAPGVDQTSQSPAAQKYLGRANTLLWYVRSSEGLTFWSQTRTDTVLYHGEAFRASKIMNFPG